MDGTICTTSPAAQGRYPMQRMSLPKVTWACTKLLWLLLRNCGILRPGSDAGSHATLSSSSAA
eukprot:scaffold116122_cov69-Phaeocystis_antarctica.AAC.4